jgi:Flp pilus assembly protein TadG
VELAAVLPLLSLLLFGTIELGLAWVADNRVEGAVGQAARIGAASGSRQEADRDLLVALRAALPADQLAALDRVVVFLASDPAGQVPAGCIKAEGSPSDVGATGCNSYSGATVRLVSVDSMVGFGGTAGTKDASWPPATRADALADPPDYLGVWVRTEHRSITGFGFAAVTVEASSVYRIQPDLSG